jgi:translation initiation factor IF-3
MQHPELGKRILDEVAAEVVDTGRVEVFPKLDGRNMTMVLAPDKKAQAAKAAERKRDKEEAEATAVATDPAPETDHEPPITEIIEAELDANLATDGVAQLDPDDTSPSADEPDLADEVELDEA